MENRQTAANSVNTSFHTRTYAKLEHIGDSTSDVSTDSDSDSCESDTESDQPTQQELGQVAENEQLDSMPRPTNQVNLFWRDAKPGVVANRINLCQLQEVHQSSLKEFGSSCQETDGAPVLNVCRADIDTNNPTLDPQLVEEIPLHDLVTLHQRMERERSAMFGELIVPGKISGLGVRMLLDTGASVSLISTGLWENLHAVDPRITMMPSDAKIRTVSGELARVRGQVILELAIGNQYYLHQFLVLDVKEDIILGLDFVQRYEVGWNWCQGTLTLRGRETVAFKRYNMGDSKSWRLATAEATRVPAKSIAVVETKIQSCSSAELPDWGGGISNQKTLGYSWGDCRINPGGS